MPFLQFDWIAAWACYALSRVSFVEFLEYCGSFSILIAVILYFVEAPERLKTKHYQAWQVINTAQGKGGSGGRIDALHELNEDHVPLVGVDVSDAFLQGVQLPAADLRRSTLSSADMRTADLSRADLEQSDLKFTNLRNANLQGADLSGCFLGDADLTSAVLSYANLAGANLDRADLRDADLQGILNWKSIAGLRLTDIHGIHNAPDGFTAWATAHGAVDLESTDAWNAALAREATTQSR